ncbi:MAG: magnesium transporter MgtC [Thiotrichales bacterium 32-46-8]|nr:MAG: magnesium transporter MgtC [Thiotrichales bacterium 32-46-8]OYZ06458.1 MAG: magnesium transporter MgtC [Thiotrichales bacterium 16-46-22]
MSFITPELVKPVEAFLTSAAIGLLIGMERERLTNAIAGFRTFSLVAVFGTLLAMLSEQLNSSWLLAVGLLVVTMSMIAGAFFSQVSEKYHGFTTEIAVLITYGLGVAVWYGFSTLAVMLAIGTTVLLYLKAELKQLSEQMTRRDTDSILQFAVLALVVLPILPDENFGPYGAINPQQVWWMVVLISGMALAGYLALRIIGAKHGAALLGVFGGLASSTATTMMFSRHAASNASLVPLSAVVVLIANVMVMIRLGIIAVLVVPSLMQDILFIFMSGIVPGLMMIAYRWRSLTNAGELPLPVVTNPTELKTALSFGLLYAVVLVSSAWLQDQVGQSGLFAVAFASGLTDADASALSTLRLFAIERVTLDDAVIAVTLALLANLLFKIGLVLGIGGKALSRDALPGLLLIGIGLSVALVINQRF